MSDLSYLSTLITTPTLSKHLLVSRTTIYKWMREGMPTMLLGGTMRRWDLAAVEAWIEEHNKLKPRRWSKNGVGHDET